MVGFKPKTVYEMIVEGVEETQPDWFIVSVVNIAPAIGRDRRLCGENSESFSMTPGAPAYDELHRQGPHATIGSQDLTANGREDFKWLVGRKISAKFRKYDADKEIPRAYAVKLLPKSKFDSRLNS